MKHNYRYALNFHRNVGIKANTLDFLPRALLTAALAHAAITDDLPAAETALS